MAVSTRVLRIATERYSMEQAESIIDLGGGEEFNMFWEVVQPWRTKIDITAEGRLVAWSCNGSKVPGASS